MKKDNLMKIRMLDEKIRHPFCFLIAFIASRVLLLFALIMFNRVHA